MKRLILAAALCSTFILAAVPASAEVDFGADAVNRYVWRGTDFGNAVSVQPGMSFSTGAVEIGAWSSWAISGGGANENDLYVSFGAGPVGITITDYYFPGLTADDMFFSFSDGEATYDLGEIDETAVSITVGAGNGVYTTDTDPMLVSAGVNFSKGDYFASYILNPDKESSFMVFGKSF